MNGRDNLLITSVTDAVLINPSINNDQPELIMTTIYLPEEEVVEVELEEAEEPQEFYVSWLFFVWVISISENIINASSMGMSLAIGEKRSPSIVVPATTATFFSDALSNYEETKEIAETWQQFYQKGFPMRWPNYETDPELQEKWPRLSPAKEYAARLITLPLTAWDIISRGTQAWYFVSAIPSKEEANFTFAYWNIINSVVSVWATTTGILNISKQYKNARELFLGNDIEFSTPFHYWASTLLGFPLGLVRTLQTFAQSKIAISAVLNINSILGVSIIDAICLLNLLPNLRSDSQESKGLLNDILMFAQKRKATALQVTSYLLALTVCGLIEYLKMPLNEEFCKSAVNETVFLPFKADTLPEDFYYILTLLIALEAWLRETHSLQGPLHDLLKSKIDQLTSYFQKKSLPQKVEEDIESARLLREESDSEEEIEEAVEEAPTIPSETASSLSQHSLFRKQEAKLKFPQASSQEKSRCCVLF